MAGVPITYVTLNHLLNLVDQLRTFADLVAYLDARQALGDDLRRMLGHERLFFGHYLRNGEEFTAVRPLLEVATTLGQGIATLGKFLWVKHVADVDAAVVEHIADALATHDPNYVTDLDPETLARYELDEGRSHYSRLQEELCELRLGGRRALGGTARRRFEALPDTGIKVQSCHLDTKPTSSTCSSPPRPWNAGNCTTGCAASSPEGWPATVSAAGWPSPRDPAKATSSSCWSPECDSRRPL